MCKECCQSLTRLHRKESDNWSLNECGAHVVKKGPVPGLPAAAIGPGPGPGVDPGPGGDLLRRAIISEVSSRDRNAQPAQAESNLRPTVFASAEQRRRGGQSQLPLASLTLAAGGFLFHAPSAREIARWAKQPEEELAALTVK